MKKVFFSKILPVNLAILILSSCYSSAPPDLNEKFERNYGGQVTQILDNKKIKERDFRTTSVSHTRFNLDPNFKLYSKPSEILSTDSPVNHSASFETHKLHLKTPENNLPSGQTYSVGKKNSASSQIPDDIFDINYNTAPHPPFQITGIDFDIIVIPQKDAYGVPSSLNEKQYPITGSNYVSRNVNAIIKNRSEEDVEFSEKLIEEQKSIRKQIAINQLYESENIQEIVDKDSYDYDNTKEEWAVEKRKIRNDPINKIIASQVVLRNLKTINQRVQEEESKNKK